MMGEGNGHKLIPADEIYRMLSTQVGKEDSKISEDTPLPLECILMTPRNGRNLVDAQGPIVKTSKTIV